MFAADAESRKEDFFQKTAEVMGLPLDSPVGILQLVVRRIFQYDKNVRHFWKKTARYSVKLKKFFFFLQES
jgi:hypothetical protein